MTSAGEPEIRSLDTGGGALLSVDVEEWYHNCWVPEFVRPDRRPRLPEELDHLLPSLLDRFDRLGARATFFVLGEVVRRLPQRVRELAARGHEVASHGELHLRVDELSVDEFRRALGDAKARLEDVLGTPVAGYRAPEWSLRRTANPRLRVVAELGFQFDSSLMSAAGAGSRSNPDAPSRLTWRDGVALLEFPPMVWGGAFRIPAGGWCGRLAPPAWLAASARRAARAGNSSLFVVHPWELVDRPCPGTYSGLARWFHDAGRVGFEARFDRLMRRVECRETMGELARRCVIRKAERGAPAFELGGTLESAVETRS